MLAAICAAPMIYGEAGFLNGKKATCYPGFEKYLEGAEFTDEAVTVCDNFITGKGAGVSMIFGADTVIEVKNTSDRGVNIALMADGRSVCDIEPQQTIRIRTADRSVKFITFGGNATIDKLCLKMKMSNAKYN